MATITQGALVEVEEIPVGGVLAKAILGALAWHRAGDPEAVSCAAYVYSEEMRAVAEKVDVRFERFVFEDGSDGYRIVMEPKVPGEEMPSKRFYEC